MRQSDALAFLPLIKAWGEGKTIQLISGGCWTDLKKDLLNFHYSVNQYRIKPETIKYRKYLARCGWDYELAARVFTVHNDGEVSRIEPHPSFIRWIDTEWQELEI